jgi:hypothetical protein
MDSNSRELNSGCRKFVSEIQGEFGSVIELLILMDCHFHKAHKTSDTSVSFGVLHEI